VASKKLGRPRKPRPIFSGVTAPPMRDDPASEGT
jgi:hypothetical protein